MAHRTYIDEIEDPVTGDRHRLEAPTEAELDALTEQHLETFDSDEVPRAPSGPMNDPVDPTLPLNPA